MASMLLSAKVRPHMVAFYNFARHADDIADHTTIKKDERLKSLMEINHNLNDGNEINLPGWALPYLHIVNEGHCSKKYGLALLSAFIQDVTKSRYESWDELIDYCMRSAAPVGRTVLELHNETEANFDASDKLCNVLQILNHLQDLKEDFLLRDRVYIPSGWLGDINELGQNNETKGVRNSINRSLDRVDKMVIESEPVIPSIAGFRLRAEIDTIFYVAKTLSKKLRKNDPIKDRVRLSSNEKLSCFIKGIFYSFKSVVRK